MSVGVVGAGITGLAVTHHLAQCGVDVATFEADAEPGGVIRSGRVDGRLLEYGPQRLRLTPAVAALVDDLGLRDAVRMADDSLPLYVYADGALREVPRSVASFLRTDLLSWRGKLRLLAEPLTGPGRPEERAADLFRRKFGDEAYRNVIEPLFGGIYGSDPAAMPAARSLSRLFDLEERHGSLLRVAARRLRSRSGPPPPASFIDGLQTLPRALAGEHRGAIRLDAPVEEIRAHEGDEDGYVLAADGRTVAVDAVVVTVPAPTAATLLDGLDGATAAPLADLAYNPLVLVHLRADANADGFGYQVRRDERLETLGVTWNAGLFDRDEVYTAFLGGMDDPDAVDRSDAALARTARREFRAVMGVDPEVLSVTRLRRALPAYDASWRALDDVALPEGVVLATNYTGRIGIPGRVREARRVAERLADA